MRFLISNSTQSQILMTMDITSGIAMNTSLYVDNNLSISGTLIVGTTDILSTLTDIQTSFNNVYTKTQTDNLLNNKQAILNSSSLITVNKITANSYASAANSDHIFVDNPTGTTRLTLGLTTNTFTNRVVAPAVNANGTLLTTSTAESVEIGRNGPGSMVR